VHANTAADALSALVNAALMAGENVTESVVCKVFSESIDLVVHLDRDDQPRGARGGIRRQVMEIAAVVPSLRADFTVEPIFRREALGEPLRWTGVVPESLAVRVDRALPDHVSLRRPVQGTLEVPA
jgi:pilus assembly protein CpaF